MRAAVCHMLRGMNLEPVEAENGERAIELYMEERPAIVLLDVNMPGIDGYETARRIREASPEEWVPIIFLSANESDQDFNKAIESGGDDYLVKPVGRIVLAAKIRALQRLEQMRRKLVELTSELAASNRRLEQLSQSDGLTGVANRRYFDNFLAHHMALAARQKTNLSLVLCDVDCFKAYNDHYGHLAGDECLRKVAQILQTACQRSTDLVARYGGEEFALVLPDTHRTGAAQHVRNIRQALAEAAIEHARSTVSPYVTLSIGIAAYIPGKDMKPEDLIARADEALYRAKAMGRNRYVVV
ncbi:MAG: diguanylate cyclase [Burkholderiales bacterium]|nr:diguanylate cyclase [Burkholderiales bacterium]PZN05869.1 MAG: diguanylate cyclase response regulator [Pseudomonadota bacterium]